MKSEPAQVASPGLIKFNKALADELGITASDIELENIFSGSLIPEGAEPLAMAYAGHQFGHFSPQLGDGRALLLGEVDSANGMSMSIQLKGSGQTHFSRNGDGLAALGPVLREYLLSEAMEKLGVPTTRALAAVTTGEQVAREQLLPGGVITRVASSFVRVGTFQYFAARGEHDAVKSLADYVIAHNYPDAGEAEQPYLALFELVIERQARLIAQWMQLGFIHGVMNTDNMSIAGETIDYGPCAFMDAFDHDRVFSSIDRDGRYAYNSQPGIGLWNLTRLAETLLPLFADNRDEAVELAQARLKNYVKKYEAAWLDGMRAKCGLTKIENTDDDDSSLIDELLTVMAGSNADFTLTFFYLSRLSSEASTEDDELRGLFDKSTQLDSWLKKWRARLKIELHNDAQRQSGMQAVNPVYIPRNHLVEAAIRAAEDRDDFSVFHALHDVLQKPFKPQQGKDKYMQPPSADEVVKQTFCGT